MLHCTISNRGAKRWCSSILEKLMNILAAEDTKATPLQIGLDNLLADLDQARSGQDLGKLALLVYCEVRCWARQAGETAIAEHSTTMFTAQPHDS